MAAPGVDLATWLVPGVLSLPRVWRGLRSTTRASAAGIGVCAALALGAMVLHSLVGGAGPQAPANTLVFVVLLMLVWSPATTAEAAQDWPQLEAAPLLLLGLSPGPAGMLDDGVVASDREQPGS